VYRIQPYLKGRGPTVTVVLGDYPEVWAVEGGRRTLVFQGGPYRPGLHASRSRRAQADDIIGFASAYAERGDEFDRDPSEPEQQHRAWWARHGDAVSGALGLID